MFRKYIESTNQLIISNSICEKIMLFSLFSSLRALHRMRAKFPHVARAEDRRPSWRLYGLRNFDFVALTGKKMQLYVRTSRAALALRVCVSSYATNTYVLTIYMRTHRLVEVRETESREFRLWIAREWPRGSRHMLAPHEHEQIFRDIRRMLTNGMSAWFWVNSSIFGLILHNTTFRI